MKKTFLIPVLTVLLMNWAMISTGQSTHDNSSKVQLAVVKEVLQTSSYTYLHVKAGAGGLQWLAIPARKFNVGDTCYFKGGLVMPDFKSKELNRSFDQVIFLEGISTTAEGAKNSAVGVPEHGTKPKPGKSDIKIKPAADGITIAELFKNKEKYKDKVVRIRGEVVKFNTKILGKNWVHLQDGTSFGDKFDLTATLKSTLAVGDVITLECKVTLNKDFGSGYFFDVILEDAIIK